MADRSAPAIADEVMELDVALRGGRREVGRKVAEVEAGHGDQ